MDIFKKLGWFFKAQKKAYILGVTALVTVSLLQIVSPRIIGLVIDEIAEKRLTFQRLVMWVSIMVVVAVLQYALRYVWRNAIWGSAAKLEKQLRQQLFHHFTQMDNVFFQKYRTGDLMAHATNDLTAIQNVAGAGILTFADSLVNGGVTVIAMIAFVDWRLTLIALLPLPILALSSQKLGEKLHHAFRQSQAAFSTINEKTQESITGIKVIKTFGQEREDVADFAEKVQDAVAKGTKVNRLDAMYDPIITIVVGLSYVLTIIVGGRLVLTNAITIGQLITFIDYISMLIWPMFAIGHLFNILERGNASYDRVQELLAEKSHIVERPDANLEPARGTLDFGIEGFRYPGAEAETLTDIHFQLKAGQTLGIVGRTGAGKTTILKLLNREYDDYQGQINFGGRDIRHYSLDGLLNALGYVPQEHFLFSMSIRDNIRFSQPQASEATVRQAATLSAVDEDILNMPEAYDTMVGERGVSLSGGQKQRLSIARALLAEPEVLILDDALSAVDAKTEETILANLKEVRHERTTIITAHRLSSVMHAEEIIVVDAGRIVERGTHQELLQQKGWYSRIFEQQQLAAKIEGGAV